MLSAQPNGPAPTLDFPWLEGFDPSISTRLLDVLDQRSEPAGTTLLDQNRPNHQLWFVAQGSVAVERSQPGSARAEILVELAGPAIYGTTTFFRNSLPTMTIRARSPIQGWTLDRAAYDQLRVSDPDVAEALALVVVQVLSERFDMLDRRLTDQMAAHDGDHRRVTEWAEFRSRLFEEPTA